MISSSETVNAIAQLFCEATQEVVGTSTGQEVSYSQTMQMIPSIHLRPDIGCFVLFSGDYSGLMIMNGLSWYWPGWMHSTGHTSTQAAYTSPRQPSTIT